MSARLQYRVNRFKARTLPRRNADDDDGVADVCHTSALVHATDSYHFDSVRGTQYSHDRTLLDYAIPCQPLGRYWLLVPRIKSISYKQDFYPKGAVEPTHLITTECRICG